MESLLRDGGWVFGSILLLSLAVWTLVFSKVLQLRDVSRGGTQWVHGFLKHGRRLEDIPAEAQNGLVGLLLQEAVQSRHRTDCFERSLRPKLRFEASSLQRHVGLIATMAALLPLLGLLGTVLGMIVTFEALTLHGAAEASRLAGGISQALLTTQAGLVCALPVFIARAVLHSRIRRFLQRAELCLHQTELVFRGATEEA